MNINWLAKNYLENFRDNLLWEISALRISFLREYGFKIFIDKAYEVKRITMEIIYGNEEKQYANIWKYGVTFRESNAGTIMKINVEVKLFKRFYMCLGAWKRGFLTRCRKVIKIDGSYLKGIFKGHLPCAIGKDANENMFPITFAIIEIENKET